MQFDLPDLSDIPLIGGDKPKNNKGQNGGVTEAEELILRAVRPEVRSELEDRLDTLATLDAWEAMTDYDGPIATLMSILSPEGVEKIRDEYLQQAAENLTNKSTPKVSAKATFDQFAKDVAWELKRVAAQSPYRLTLVIGEITAKDSAEQAMVNEVLEGLIENPALADDYVIVTVPREKAASIIDQIAGSVDEWKVPMAPTSTRSINKPQTPSTPTSSTVRFGSGAMKTGRSSTPNWSPVSITRTRRSWSAAERYDRRTPSFITRRTNG